MAALSLAITSGGVPFGTQSAVPEARVDIVIAEFVERRHVRRRPPALGLQHGEGLELAALHVSEVEAAWPNVEVDMAAEQVLRQRCAAAIGHDLEMPCRCPSGKMRAATSVGPPTPTVPIVALPFCALSQAMQPFDVVGRQRLRAMIQIGVSAISETGAKSFTTS